MANFWVTVGHTIRTRLQSKAFLWSTIIMMFLIIGLMNINTFISFFSDDGPGDDGAAVVAVVDETTDEEEIAAMLQNYEESSLNYELFTDGDEDEALEEARDEQYDFVLTLSGDTTGLEVDFYGDSSDFTIGQEVNQDVQRMKESAATNQLDLNDEELAMINAPIQFDELPLAEGGEVQTEETQMQAYWLVYALVFAIYLIVIMFGSIIATEVATEKSSRVMELIVSSVNPVTQMFGKLVGIGLVGLLNMSALAAAIVLGSAMSNENVLEMVFGASLDISLLLYAIVLVMLGYFVYGGLAAMLGALVSRAEEVNQAIQPLIYLAMIAFFIALFGLNVPDNTMIHVLSYVPFFTPQLLFLRIGMGTVPMWEVILIMAILIISAILINILAARIYKGGVLMYGKFSFKNGIKQALAMGKKE